MKKNSITRKSYDNIADMYSKMHFGPSNMFLSFFYGLMDIKNRNTVLDIGSGTGRDALELSKYFKKVICLDYSQSMLNTIKVRENISLIAADILDEKLAFQKLSAIWMNGVIHHINPEQYDYLFKRLFDWLDISSPLFLSYRCDICNSFDNEFIGNQRYYYCMNYENLNTILKKAGFSLVRHFEIKKKPTDTKNWVYIKAIKL